MGLNNRRIRNSLLLFLLCAPLAAQDCSFGANFTTTGTSTPFYNLISGGCVYWNVTATVTGFSGFSVTFQGAPDASGSPGSFSAVGTVVGGVNPIVTNNVTLVTNEYHDWLRMDLTSATGTGTVVINAYGYVRAGISLSQIAPIANGTVLCNRSGTSASPSACTSPLLSNNSAATPTIGQGFDLVQDGTPAAVAITNYGINGIVNSPGVFGIGARGSLASPAAVQADDVLLSVAARGYFGLGFAAQAAARMGLKAAETWGNINRATYIEFDTTPHNSTTPAERMRIFSSGGVSIGNTTDPGGTNLSVTGTVASGNGLTGHAACWNGTVLSYCTSAVANDGTCTCH